MNDVVDEEDATGVMALEIFSSKITDHIATLQCNITSVQWSQNTVMLISITAKHF